MASIKENYSILKDFYEDCFEKYGATPRGVDWPNLSDLSKRFNIMLGLIPTDKKPISLLDLGCGYGEMVNYLNKNNLNDNIIYSGIDLSLKMVAKAKEIFPEHTFYVRDILQNPLEPNFVDYIIMNGLLTEKRSLGWDEMVTFAKTIIKAAFTSCRKGIAFNVMSQHVDWCNPNLFHWSFDEVATFVFKECSRNLIFRNDYGLYEYTVYVYKNQ